jgi:TM2 domain-containing membrane protein YozV
MEQQKIDLFIALKSKFFDSSKMPVIIDRLQQMDDSKWLQINIIAYKEPSNMLIISFLGGALGIDRFILGDTGIGIGKLLTAGGCGIWALVDLFMIQDAARNKNWELLQMHLY